MDIFVDTFGPGSEIIGGHTGPITACAWSPDGTRLATGAYDGAVIVWKWPGGEIERRLKHSRLVNGVRWSPDGRYLGVACADNHCHIWDAQSFSLAGALCRHRDDVNDVSWSFDGSMIATVSEDGQGILWDGTDFSLFAVGLTHADHCMSVDWHPSQRLLATCGEDSTVRLWSEVGESIAAWPQPASLESVRWSPDGERLAVSSYDGTIRILDREGSLVRTLGDGSTALKGLAWMDDSNTIASGGYDCEVCVWNLGSDRPISTFSDARLWPRSISWNPKHPVLAVGVMDSVPSFLELRSQSGDALFRRNLHRDASPKSSLGINSVDVGGDCIVMAVDDGTIRSLAFRETEAKLQYKPKLPSSLVNSVCVGSEGLVAFGTFDGIVGVITRDGTLICTVDVSAPVNCVAWSGLESRIAIVDYFGTLTIAEFDGEQLETRPHKAVHDAAIKAVVWATDETLITASTDDTLKVISTDGFPIRVLKGHANLVNDLAVSSDGERAVSASRDRTVRVWSVETGKCEEVLTGHRESVKSIALVPGRDNLVVSGSYDFDARLWNLDAERSSPSHSQVLRHHRHGVGSVAATNELLVTASWDASIAQWELRSDSPPQLVSVSTLGHA